MATSFLSHRVPVLAAAGLTIAFLATAAALTPEQSPVLPLEISVVLAVLGGWFALRGSRAALAVLTVFAGLLVLLSLHILTGDLGSSGARELVPDVAILASTGTLAILGGLRLAGRVRARH